MKRYSIPIQRHENLRQHLEDKEIAALSNLSIIIAILLFGFMILFHELGHFAMAKWAGVKVNEFAIGMGPKIISKTVGDTT